MNVILVISIYHFLFSVIMNVILMARNIKKLEAKEAKAEHDIAELKAEVAKIKDDMKK